MKDMFIVIVMILATLTANAQTSILEVIPEIQLPKDSIESERLIYSLNQFLIEANADAKNKQWVYESEYLETTLLLDEIEGIQEQEKDQDTLFYKPVLLDLSPLEDEQYFIQVSYIGTADLNPKIRGSIELIAHKTGDKYLFSSPLIRNTKNWQTSTIENYTIHYEGVIEVEKSREYIEQRAFHDNNLNLPANEITFYLLDEGVRSQQYFGLPYKLDYNGNAGKMRWTVILENQEIYLMHKLDLFEFDPHDLWHNRLNQVTSRRKVNHSVDEGIAMLYGGSYGVTWKELFVAFQEQIKFDENTDWLELKEQKVTFLTDGHKNPTDFMANALFVKKIEKEKGFAAVMELLNAKETAAYFKTLHKLTGVSKDNYNRELWKLIRQELVELNIKEVVN